MLRHLISKILLSICLMSTPAWGDGVFLIDGGVSIARAPDFFTDFWGVGMSFGGGGGITIGDSKQSAVLFSIDYSRHTMNEGKLLAAAGIPAGQDLSLSGGTLIHLNVLGNFRHNLKSVDEGASPFVIGGVGISRLSASDITVAGGGQVVTEPIDDSSTKLGISFGAGVDIPAGEKFGIFIELKYGIGFTENESTQTLPVRVGLIFR